MTRRSAKIDGLTRVECLVPEVFTGMEKPDRLRKGQREELPYQVALELIQSGACKGV